MKPIVAVVVFAVGIVTGQLIAQTKPDTPLPAERVSVGAEALLNGLPTFADRLVQEVQQQFHDEFIDTTWPACPHHSNPPLWLHDHDQNWRCEALNVVVAPLGSLRARL